MRPPDISKKPFPEIKGFCVWIVDTEDPDTLPYPKLQNFTHRMPEFLPCLGFKIEWVDILILFRGIFRIANGSVSPMTKPLWVVGHPWMIRRTLQRKIESKFHAPLAHRMPQRLKVIERAEIRMDIRVTTCSRSNPPWTAHILCVSLDRIIFAFTK